MMSLYNGLSLLVSRTRMDEMKLIDWIELQCATPFPPSLDRNEVDLDRRVRRIST